MKLSQKKAQRLSFVASKLALSVGHDERLALLAELLDELGIDPEQRKDSMDSAQRSVNYDARQRRKVQAATDSATAALRKQLDEARAKRDELLDKLAQRLATAAGNHTGSGASGYRSRHLQRDGSPTAATGSV